MTKQKIWKLMPKNKKEITEVKQFSKLSSERTRSMGGITGFAGRPRADRAPLKHWID